MAQQMIARVTCPACQNPFQAPVEQVLDVKADPSARTRVLSGAVNVAQCPHCGAQGALNMPFLYHDPEKALALVYMPMEAGRDNEERQQTIGRLTQSVMNNLPAEERKAYLLQPQVFLTMENLRKKILREEGVTDEMMEEQEAKANLLQRMLEAPSEEALEAMIKENDELIDAVFFQMLNANVQLAQARGPEESVQKLLALRDRLMDLTDEGRAMRERGEMVEKLREEPNRDNLLELLIEAPDAETRETLVAFGRPLMDYLFFQNLTAKIEAASNEDEKERLRALRKEVLDTRDRLDQRIQALYQARAEFLRDLMMSDNPRELALRRIGEVDEVFLNVLSANLEQAQKEDDREALEALRALWDMFLDMMEESLPPELRFFNQLLAAEEEGEIDRLLEENQEMVTERMARLVEEMAAGAREEDNQEATDRMASIAEKVRGRLAAEKIVTG